MKRFKEIGLSIDDLKQMEPRKLETAFYPPENRRDTSIPLPDFDAVHAQMVSMGRKADLAYIWLDYKALHPDGYQQSQFYKLYRDYVKENFGADEATMPVERIPGEKMYIDWVGDQPCLLTDPSTGELLKVHIFATTLGFSSCVYAEAFTDEKQTITIYTTASTIRDVYSLEVLNIKGAENIEKIEAFVTGQILSNYFGRPERDKLPATVYVEMKSDIPNSRLYTVFDTFGKLPGAENKVYLDITVTDSGGEQYRYIYDVTPQFDDPNNKNNKLIIDGSIIDIPEAEQGGGGFKPSVDEWGKEDIDVPLT
jgi:hypothetical protein